MRNVPQFGKNVPNPTLVDYSGRQDHTKHSTICVKHVGQCTEYLTPTGYKSEGVTVPSTILQRILREYKNISKRIILTGNSSYIHIQTDSHLVPVSLQWRRVAQTDSVYIGRTNGGCFVPFPFFFLCVVSLSTQ